jgi:hypothetical protein
MLSLSKDSSDHILRRIITEDVRMVYSIGKKLGAGNFGTVRLCHKIGQPETQFAIKSIPRRKVENNLELLE